jgi:hypothetical protein
MDLSAFDRRLAALVTSATAVRPAASAGNEGHHHHPSMPVHATANADSASAPVPPHPNRALEHTVRQLERQYDYERRHPLPEPQVQQQPLHFGARVARDAVDVEATTLATTRAATAAGEYAIRDAQRREAFAALDAVRRRKSELLALNAAAAAEVRVLEGELVALAQGGREAFDSRTAATRSGRSKGTPIELAAALLRATIGTMPPNEAAHSMAMSQKSFLDQDPMRGQQLLGSSGLIDPTDVEALQLRTRLEGLYHVAVARQRQLEAAMAGIATAPAAASTGFGAPEAEALRRYIASLEERVAVDAASLRERRHRALVAQEVAHTRAALMIEAEALERQLRAAGMKVPAF